MKPLHRLFLACSLSGIVGLNPCAAASAQEINALLVPVNTWVNAFNNWDSNYPSTAFTENAVVIDQFEPFLWQGQGSARAWWTSLLGSNPEEHKTLAAMHQHVEFSAPQFVQIRGNNAYFVQPAKLTWNAKDGAHEMKASWVATETKTDQGWRITSHAWAPLSETAKGVLIQGGTPPM